MKYQYTELPVYVDKAEYDAAIRRMADLLISKDYIKTVYQVGGVSNPGISDIDLYVVFHENANTSWNPVKDLPFPDGYLFTHRLFGTTEKRADEMEKFTFFGTYNYVDGNRDPIKTFPHSENDTRLIKRQVALEYLVKAWITISNGIYLKKIKVRSFLLLAKAIQYDLDFIGDGNKELRDCISEIIETRNHWFQKPSGNAYLDEIVDRYSMLLQKTLVDEMKRGPLFLHPSAQLQISKRIKIDPSGKLKMEHTSIPFLKHLPFAGKVHEKFTFSNAKIPVERASIPKILLQRHEVLSEAFAYNSQHLPGFICTGHGMNIFNH